MLKRTLSAIILRSEEHTSELQSHLNLVCRLLLEKKNRQICRSRRSRKSSVETLSRSLYCLYFFLITPHLTSSTFFFFNDTATTEIYTLSLHDALPIYEQHP